MNFTNRVAIVTGGTGGLGVTVTQAFLQHGASVATCSQSEKNLSELKRQLGPEQVNLFTFIADMTKEAEVQRFVQNAMEYFGYVDILINLIGGFMGGMNVVDTTEVAWDKMMTLNLKTTFLACKTVLPHMMARSYGRIVNISSKSALEIAAGTAAYAVSKSGVITLTQALAQEVKKHRITVNVVLPGTIDTATNRQTMPDADFTTWVKPATIAHLLLFLASEECGDITGATIPILGRG